MVKKHFLLSCIFMTVTLCGQAQTETPQLASKPLAALTATNAGKLYILTCKIGGKFFKAVPHILLEKDFLYYIEGKCEKEEVLATNHLFRILQDKDSFYLYDVIAGYYVGRSQTPDNYYRFTLYDKANELCLLSYDNKFKCFKLATRYLRCNNNSTYFGSYTSADQKLSAQLYAITNLPSYGVTLTEDSLLPAKINKGEDAAVSLHRTFEPNALNTLILPFDVENYREVFGMQTTVYRLNEDNTQAIEFISMDNGETMKANKPYLIKGESFNSQPFIFPASTKFQYGGEEQTVKVGDITYHATYEYQEFKEAADLYVVANNKIYSCKNRTIKIKPYRWYITSEKAATAKEFLLNIGTGIQNMEYRETKKNTSAIYNLQGMKVADADTRNSLPHGIYICNGKKFVQ